MSKLSSRHFSENIILQQIMPREHGLSLKKKKFKKRVKHQEMLEHFFVYDYKETLTNIAWIKIGKNILGSSIYLT